MNLVLKIHRPVTGTTFTINTFQDNDEIERMVKAMAIGLVDAGFPVEILRENITLEEVTLK